MEVVLDVNVYISSIISSTGASHKIVELALDGKVKVFTSLEILEELEEKLRDEFKHPEEIIERQIALVLSYAKIVNPKVKVSIVKEDPDDDKFIECALEANVGNIISWDNHLLKLKKVNEIIIINPGKFLSEFRVMKLISESEDDIKKGRVKEINSVDDFIK